MEKDLISIIVPIYNVEKYIRKCINSIINQTYKNLDIILIDDGSPDRCGKIIEQYSQNDKRIVCVHKKNGGLSDARNSGLDIAKGEYITFVDSDDFIANDFIEKLYDCIKKNKTLISQCGIAYVDDCDNLGKKIIPSKNLVEKYEYLKEMYNEEHSTDYVVVWNKMYHRSIFNKLRFPVGKIHEDEFTTYKFIYFQDKVTFTNDTIYFYRQNDDSITRKKFNIKRLDCLEALEERIIFYKSHNEEELINYTKKHYLHILILNYMKLKKYYLNEKNKRKKIVMKFKKNYDKKINLNFKEKIKFFIFKLNPEIFYLVFKKLYSV